MDFQQEAGRRAAALNRRFEGIDGEALLREVIETEFKGRIALVSSFGTESALLLALAARIDRSLPILFLDTGQMFSETLAYRDLVIRRLGLTGVETIKPAANAISDRDPEGQLWAFDTDACCALRKVEPLAEAMSGYEAIISGRKRYHGALRQFIPRVEAVDGLIKIDPIADWSRERVEDAFEALDLPRHPLEALGYRSVGCRPCTAPTGSSDDPRAGRWAGLTKTECGIHHAGRALPKVPAAATLGSADAVFEPTEGVRARA